MFERATCKLNSNEMITKHNLLECIIGFILFCRKKMSETQRGEERTTS